MDNAESGRRFRDRYVRGVRRLIQAGVLEIEDPAELITILDDVQACDRVVYTDVMNDSFNGKPQASKSQAQRSPAACR